jgi:hypothetical protein
LPVSIRNASVLHAVATAICSKDLLETIRHVYRVVGRLSNIHNQRVSAMRGTQKADGDHIYLRKLHQ